MPVCPRTKPRNGGVDLDRQGADGRSVPARQPCVDGRDHPVPVPQEIEGDHRNDDQQRRDRDQRLAAGPQAAHEHRQSAGRLLHHVADITVAGADTEDIGEPGPARIGDDRLHLGGVTRQIFRQSDQLPDQNRNQHHAEDDDDHQERADDRQCRQRACETQPLEPVGERIEQVGENESGDERQQDFPQRQHRSDEHREGDAPEDELAVRIHGPARSPAGINCRDDVDRRRRAVTRVRAIKSPGRPVRSCA
jgi:hypothetical protein